MKKIRISILVMCMALLASCQEEVKFNQQEAEVGLPASIDLKIEVPQGETVETRASATFESVINTMALVMFEQSTGQKHYVDLTGKLTSNSMSQADLDKGYRTYTLSSPVSILSGNYHVYAVANMESAFSPMKHEAPLSDLEETEDEFLSRTIRTANAVWSAGSGYLPMTAKHVGSGTEGDMVTIYPDERVKNEGLSNTKINLQMRRVTSRIEFKFINGGEVSGATNAVKQENPKFIPMSYRVYNIPKHSYLMDQTIMKHSGNTNNSTSNVPTNPNVINGLSSSAYGHSGEITVTGDGVISFFMLENLKYGSNCTSYEARDTWYSPGYTDQDDANGTTQSTLPENKVFKNAPEYSTFVVVSGEYTSTTYIGDVSYTIHLGNFSGKSTDRSISSLNNFCVNRNESHTYNVTVNGVNSIVTESEVETDEVGGDKPGVEGSVTKVSKGTQFVLDAHYERVMLQFTLDSKCAKPTIMIQSPYSPGKDLVQYNLIPETDEEIEALKTADIGWVKFMAPTSTSSFPNYPESTLQATALTDVVGLAKELQAAWNNGSPVNAAPDGAHYLLQRSGNTCTVYVVAFVDEYFYETEPGTSIEADWRDFTNENNRIMILNPLKQISPDGNSTSYPDYIFQVSQRSIKTTYAENGVPLGNETEYRPFGIETWDETGKMPYGTPSRPTNTGSGYYYSNDSSTNNRYDLNQTDGWQNTQNILDGSGSRISWYNAVYKFSTGYLEGINDNSKESHVYYSSGDGVANMRAFYACMTRNRDEDGDGVIDDSEIKWFLPAIEQYVTIWLNNDLLHEDTQLFDPSGDALTTLTKEKNKGYNLYTSSGYSQRLYWAVEGGAYGQYADESWQNRNNGVRCVRNLISNGTSNGVKVYSGVPTSASEYDESLRRIHSINISNSTLRKEPVAGYTPQHTEREADNRLPEYFIYASDFLKVDGEYFRAGDSYMNTYTEDPCTKHYYEEVGTDGTPTDLGKWRIPNQRELMLLQIHGNLQGASQSAPVPSSTFMSNWANSNINDYPYGSFGTGITTEASQGNQYRFRCVRDDSETGFPGGDGGDSGDGGDEDNIDATAADATYDVTGNTIF